jgi:hypothetical protein
VSLSKRLSSFLVSSERENSRPVKKSIAAKRILAGVIMGSFSYIAPVLAN